MRRLFLVVFSALGAYTFFGCSPVSDVSGTPGSGQETTNGVMAVAVKYDGTPAAGATVRLRRGDYLTPVPGLARRRGIIGADATTDSTGRFEIVGIEPGEYRIEISHAGSKQAVLLDCVIDHGDNADLGSDTLRPFAVVRGTVDLAVQPAAARYVQVAGLERMAVADSRGRYTMSDLPAGMLQLRVIALDSLAASPLAIDSVIAVSGDTTVAAPAGWQFRKRLCFNTTASGADVSDNVTGFPLLVRLSSDTLGNPGSMEFDFSQAADNGDDIRFTGSDGAMLPYEIEQWDPAAQTAAVWVRVDTVYGNDSTQYLIMHWGNTTAESRSDGAAVFDTALGYAGNWHLAEEQAGTGNADCYRDATANAYHGLDNIASTERTGIIGTGHAFDTTNRDHIDLGADRPFLAGASAVTLEAWIYPRPSRSENLTIVTHSVDSPDPTNESFAWLQIRNRRLNAGGRSTRLESEQYAYSNDTLQTERWQHVAAVIDYASDTVTVFVDGRVAGGQRVSFLETVLPDAPSRTSMIGSGDAVAGFFFHGLIDEVRSQRVGRSAAWIRLSYENQKAGQTVVVFRE